MELSSWEASTYGLKTYFLFSISDFALKVEYKNDS